VLIVVCAVLLLLTGSAVLERAKPVTVSGAPSLGTVYVTWHVTFAPTAKLEGTGLGAQTTVAPVGKVEALHCTSSAASGPKLVQTTRPLITSPALAVDTKSRVVTCKSALGATAATVKVPRLMLLLGCVSGELLPAVVVTSTVPLAGAANVAWQRTPCLPTAGSAAQTGVMPLGKPPKTHVGDTAVPGPVFWQLPVTVTACPGAALAGTVVVDVMSTAKGAATVAVKRASLFFKSGSDEDVPAVPTMFTLPLAGAVYDTLHTMAAPSAKPATGEGGVHATLEPAGKPVNAQVASAATLGPWLVHVSVPVALLPASGLASNPLKPTAISATGLMVMRLLSTLLLGLVSTVPLPAVVMMFRLPLAGAAKLALQLTLWFLASGSGTGLGVQLCTAPLGKPPSTQVGATAASGPKFKQTPSTVMACPAAALLGAVVVAFMSTKGVDVSVVMVARAVLLPSLASGVLEPATPVSVMASVRGAVLLTSQVIASFTANSSGAGLGVHVKRVPTGGLSSRHVGAPAGLGPLLVQVSVVLMGAPGAGSSGTFENTATISASPLTSIDLVSALLAGLASGVREPAMVVMVKRPSLGAVKVDVHVISASTANK
jgi:hypothetical protein